MKSVEPEVCRPENGPCPTPHKIWVSVASPKADWAVDGQMGAIQYSKNDIYWLYISIY
jgi:hypothetical protein